jgi:aldehyde dehydrogenase (NAD+)
MTVLVLLFGAVGTAGQRCTSTSRIHESIYDKTMKVLKNTVTNRNPLDENNHVGPLIDKRSELTTMKALKKVGKNIVEGGVLQAKVTKVVVT